MPNRFASGRIAIAECDRCGQQYKLKQLRTEIIKQRKYELLVCPECWDPDQPQLMLGTFPIDDPQALRNPRPGHHLPCVRPERQWEYLRRFSGHSVGLGTRRRLALV
jgi:NAD-dependent SIR2 family protein deacetylase